MIILLPIIHHVPNLREFVYPFLVALWVVAVVVFTVDCLFSIFGKVSK